MPYSQTYCLRKSSGLFPTCFLSTSRPRRAALLLTTALTGSFVLLPSPMSPVQANEAIDSADITVIGSGSGDQPSPWSTGGYLFVGVNGTATLAVSDGGVVNNTYAHVGRLAGSDGTVTVDGAASQWVNSNILNIGRDGTGRLTITNGGEVSNTFGYLGHNSGAQGTITITGAGSRWVNSSGIEMAKSGTGTLTVSDGGEVTSTYGSFAHDTGGQATVTVTGTSSQLVSSGYITVGNDGTATMTVSDGGRVTNTIGSIGSVNGSDGTVTVAGGGSQWINSAGLSAGVGGIGSLSVSNGGVVSNTTGVIGTWVAGQGTATVAGSGSRWVNSGTLDIGNFGQGILTVSNGGEVSADGVVTVAVEASSTGELNIGAASGSPAAAPGTLTADTLTFGSGTGKLVFNHTGTNYAFGADVTGNGTLLNEAGITKLSGDMSGFTGTSTITGGTFVFNNTFTNAVTVASGGTIGGTGTLSSILLASGAVVAPGNSIGTLNVAGNFNFVAGSTFAVEVDKDGNADKLAVTGTVTINSGAKVVLSAENGTDDGSTYAASTTYKILTAGGGVTGRFGSVSEDFAFLDAALSYGANAITLTLNRNALDFSSTAQTPNQRATASRLDTLGPGNAVYDAVVVLSGPEAQAAFDNLSGEIHASANTLLVQQSSFGRTIVGERLRGTLGGLAAGAQPLMTFYGEGDAPDGGNGAVGVTGWGRTYGGWGEAYASWGEVSGDGGAAHVDHTSGGVVFGLDASIPGGDVLDGWRAGVLAGYGNASFDSDARASSGDSDSYQLGVYGGRQFGALGLHLGAGYAWQDISTTRNVVVGSLRNTLSANYAASTAQLFGEVGYTLATPDCCIAPFAGIALIHQQSDGFTETDGAAALSVASTSQTLGVTTLGLRAERQVANVGTFDAAVAGSVGWRHTIGDLDTVSTMRFAGGDTFDISGTRMERNTALIEAGLNFGLGEGITVSASYHGERGAIASEDGFKGKLSLRF